MNSEITRLSLLLAVEEDPKRRQKLREEIRELETAPLSVVLDEESLEFENGY